MFHKFYKFKPSQHYYSTSTQKRSREREGRVKKVVFLFFPSILRLFTTSERLGHGWVCRENVKSNDSANIRRTLCLYTQKIKKYVGLRIICTAESYMGPCISRVQKFQVRDINRSRRRRRGRAVNACGIGADELKENYKSRQE